MTLLAVLLFVVIALAWSNGANDNFKGVATLLGSGTASPRTALAYGTVTTLAGSVCALLLSGRLLAAFSGEGIVPDALVGDPAFLAATGGGAAGTVMVATLFGTPISTTHALVGGMAGAGFAASGAAGVGWERLGLSFLVPLLVSPLAAWVLVAASYPLLHGLRLRWGIEATSCLCADLEPRWNAALASPSRGFASAALPEGPRRLVLSGGHHRACDAGYRGSLLGLRAGVALDTLHYLSAGAVGFARGLNDTPKVATLVLVGGAFAPGSATVVVGLGMAAGALAQALRVGRTMGHGITPMNPGQGLTANLATAALVLGASRFGVPVSTTHVSVGALFGLGTATAGLRRGTAIRILLSWVATLPLAFLLAAGAWKVFGG